MQPFPYNIGGGTTYLLTLAKYMIRRGHRVSIITSKPGNEQKPLPLPRGLEVYNVGIPHKVFKKSSLLDTLYALVYRARWEMAWVRAAKKKLNELNPDICNPQSSITTALPCSLSGKVFVVNEHGVHLEGFRKLWSERKSKVVVWLSKVYGIIEQYNAKRAKRLFCVSKDTYAFYKKFGKSKCILLPHGVDFDYFKKIDFAKKRDYLFVGRLTEQKGFAYLINALELLDKQKVKLTIRIAGDGDQAYVAPLREKTKKFKHVKVHFLGFVTGKPLYDLYAQSSVFISSSIFEPFGLVITEAMASGCAIISANHEGGKLLVRPSYGSIVPYEQETKRAEGLAKAIQASLKWNTTQMGKNARRAAGAYSYDVLVEKYLAYYTDVIKEAKKSL